MYVLSTIHIRIFGTNILRKKLETNYVSIKTNVKPNSIVGQNSSEYNIVGVPSLAFHVSSLRYVWSSELLSVFLQISSMPHLLLAFLTVSNVIVVFGGADNCPPMDELTNILEKYTPEVNVVNRQKNDTSSSSTFR